MIKESRKTGILAKSYYDDSLIYGDDSISTLNNLAIVYTRNGIENLDSKAHELLIKALTLYHDSWGTYMQIFGLLITDTFKNPDNETQNIKEIDKWMSQLKMELTFYRSSGGDYTKNEVWRSFAGLDNFINMLKQIPSVQLANMGNELSKRIKSTPDNIDNNLAEQVISLYYSRGIPFQFQPYTSKADELMNQMIVLKKNDPNFLSWALGISLQLQRLEKSYEIGKSLEKLVKEVSDPAYYYQMGMVSFNLKKNADTKVYLNKFLDKIKDDRKAIIQLREPIQNAKNVLSQIK